MVPPKTDTLIPKTYQGERYILIEQVVFNGIAPVAGNHTDKTIKEFIYVPIDIYEGMDHHIFINDKDKLSELNRWKFNALKLDYLMKENIKLGGMKYDNLEPILDMHQDITLDDCSEYDKEQSGIPSQLTNLT